MQLNERSRWTEGLLFFAGFAACVPAANWLIENVGVTCVPNGPCLIPVAPHVDAPSGVLMIGLALVLRDLVQRRLCLWWGVGAILVGTMLSATFAPTALVVASASAFLLSEFADLLIYTPRKGADWCARSCLAVWLGWLSTASCFFGSPSAASTFSQARLLERPGWS
jgi:hypothetical protein